MAAKNRFNTIDCLAAALPDEEYFVLLARDPGMPALLGIWASLRVGNLQAATDNFMALMAPDLVQHYQDHPDTAKSEEAVATANRAIEWRAANLDGPNGRPTWKDSLVRPMMMAFEHPPCQQLAEPIPELVYWNGEDSNFYGQVSRRGQGEKFFQRWYPRRDEFPTTPHEDDKANV